MTRALVLGGGGPIGIAWECGLLTGLAQGGADLGQAESIIGTSAGAFVGLRLAMGEPAASLADPIFADADRAVKNVNRSARRPPDLTKLMRIMATAQQTGQDPHAARAELGAYALAADTIGEDEYMESFGRAFAALPDTAWPPREFACTAVDAETGAFQLWTRDSGVGVSRAVAASCSMPGVYPPVTIQGRRWYDGGGRSSTNADLAAGHDVVVVVGVRLSDWTPGGALARLFAHLDEEVAALEAGGAKVASILPDDASRAAMGGNLMDFGRRADACHAGLAQGLAAAEAISAVWG
ncbi:MAG: patatin-like phospholipase family protein [Phenylobacterium sp.]